MMRDMGEADLAAFEARLAEDERRANAARGLLGVVTDWYSAGTLHDLRGFTRADAVHAAEHSPARVLREVAAKRKLLALAAEADDIHYDRCVEVGMDLPEVLIGERIRQCDLDPLQRQILAIYDLKPYQVGMAPVPRHVRLWWGARKMLGITAWLRRRRA